MTDDRRPIDDEEERGESPGKPRIKVTDRRLFDEHGNFRSAVEDPPAESEDQLGAPDPGPGLSDEPERGERAASPMVDRQPVDAPPDTAVHAPPEIPPTEERPVPPPPAETAAPGPGVGPQSAGDGPESSGLDPGAGATGSGGAHSAAELPRDLAGFVESQYFETLLYLGAIPHPATGEVIEDADMAQYKIDLLNMLKDKTEGNRTPEESRLFDEVLYQLRMAFLQKSKVAKL